MRRSRHLIALAAACLLAGQANAKIVGLAIEKVEPFASGQAFGTAGTYERVVATAKGELDPVDPRN